MQGRIIRSVREMLGLTQQAFAERLAVSQATVSRWESGHTEPDPDSRRRIHALAGRSTSTADAALYRMVRRAPSMMALFDLNMRILAVSDLAARVNGLDPTEVVGMDYRPLFTDELAEAYETAVRHGFFTGDILGMDIACKIKGLNGEPFHVIAHWHLVYRPSDSEPLLLWNGLHVDEDAYAAARAAGPRVITLDDWLSENSLAPFAEPAVA
ncbi:helix-turn-helix domain-containing protein [Novispirillum sp. DQ9]|uniref:helix-turn-helix domain-containing protein n=1 Tax=Novispirillum sp. DQ9 TaxID=3398612 RepID=UPI003C7988ED